MRQSLFIPALWVFCLFGCDHASVTNPDPYVDPSAGDTVYALQGEYLGTNTVTGISTGAQVSARGGGTFRLLLLNGGLPGQGWNGAAGKILSGTFLENRVHIAQNGFDLSIVAKGDSLVGTNDLGQPLRLLKVHRQSSTLGQAPPVGAVVLFNGASVSKWNNAFLDSDSALRVLETTSGAVTRDSFKDFTLHLEFRLPFEPDNSSQGRGNSGVYLQGRYELQILDSFGESFAEMAVTDTVEPKRQCGAFYEQAAPLVNMAFPPLVWQTYDIDFMAARWNSSGQKTQNARVSIRQNGIAIHSNLALVNSTLAGSAESSLAGPHLLQYHGHPVSFKNIWIVPTASGLY